MPDGSERSGSYLAEMLDVVEEMPAIQYPSHRLSRSEAIARLLQSDPLEAVHIIDPNP